MRQYILSFGSTLVLLCMAPGCSKDSGGTGADGGGGGNGDLLGAQPGEIAGLISIAVTPPSTTLELDGAAKKTAAFTAAGTFNDGHTEDITTRVAWSVAQPLLGTFNGNTFETSLDRAGTTKVFATAGSKTGSGDLMIILRAKIGDPGATGLPTDPGTLFTGASDTNRAPKIVYPNDGALVPPNLGKLEFHYLRGAADNALFEIAIQSAVVDVKIYTNCTVQLNGGCIFTPDAKVWRWIAENNRGSEITVSMRGTGASGGAVGSSTSMKVAFSQDDLVGALYYWTAAEASADTRIVRWDFGSTTQTEPDLMVTPTATEGRCVGCHALSPDGTKLFVTTEGSYDSYVLLLDVATRMPLVPYDSSPNVAFASYNADGSEYVGVFADEGQAGGRFASYNLNFYSGSTGAFMSTVDVGGSEDHPITHPDWSPKGDLVAFTRINAGVKDNGSIAYGSRTNIEVVDRTAATPTPLKLTTAVEGESTYYPAFSPDGTTLIFNRSVCASGNDGGDCDMYDDPGAQLMTMRPEMGATATALAKANAPGVTDNATLVENSFPKWAPFVFQRTGEFSSRVMWVTFSSNRNYGLREPTATQTLIWMAAIDPDAPGDGSYAAFALPFQDLTTDNHTAQWAKEAVPIVE